MFEDLLDKFEKALIVWAQCPSPTQQVLLALEVMAARRELVDHVEARLYD